MASCADAFASFGDGFVTVCSDWPRPSPSAPATGPTTPTSIPRSWSAGAGSERSCTYYAQYFPIVEIDTTFYGIPRPPVVEAWVERTPEQFRFNIKAYRSLTGHEREDGRPRQPTPEEERDFMAALAPLRDSGKLVAVHYQFPPWFTNRPEAREWLLAARDRHPDDLLAIEFRHRSWFDGDAWPATEDLLRELDFVYVGVDAPQIGSATAPPLLAITSRRLCITRFHGRNRQTWYSGGPTSGDRFNYLYTPAELAEWIPGHSRRERGRRARPRPPEQQQEQLRSRQCIRFRSDARASGCRARPNR